MRDLGTCDDEAKRRMSFFVLTAATTLSNHTEHARLYATALKNHADYAKQHGYSWLAGKVRRPGLFRTCA